MKEVIGVCLLYGRRRVEGTCQRNTSGQYPIAANNGIIFNRSPQITALVGLCGLEIRV